MQQPWNPYGQQAAYAPPAPAAQGPYPPSGSMYRQNVAVPYGASAAPLVGPGLRKAKLALGVAQIVALLASVPLFVLGVMMAGEREEASGALFAVAAGSFGLWYLLLLAYGILNAVWIYKFWSWIPPEQRYTSMWKKYISPGAAVGFLFIPYFNIYWMFVVYLGIPDIMERMRVQYPSSKGSAKTLALVALVVPMVFFPAGPFLQYMFAKHVEQMASEMQARMLAGARAHAG